MEFVDSSFLGRTGEMQSWAETRDEYVYWGYMNRHLDAPEWIPTGAYMKLTQVVMIKYVRR